MLGGQQEEVASATARPVTTSWCGKVESLAENPELLITSDLPLGGPNAKVARTMADAIRLVLRHHQFEAGPYSLGYQSCNHGSTKSPGFDFGRCAANAQAFAATPRVVGVIGTYNSPCAMVEVPIANRAPDGPLVMISPSNTFPGLTIGGPESEPGEPERFYPTGVRNFFRVVASDDLQAGADAMLARTLGVRTFYVLDNGDRYGRFVAQAFRRAAGRLGIRTVGSMTWDGKAKDFRRLARVVARARPEGVFLSGVVWSNGGRLVKDLRASLGRKVVFIAPDGFIPIPPLLEDAPRAAIGMYISIAGVSNGALNPTGQAFMRELTVNRRGALPVASYVPEAAQAAEVLLAAISRSDGTRRSVLAETKATRVENGILGSFFFDRNGDISSAPIAIYRVTGNPKAGPVADFGGAQVDRVVHVPLTVVR
jgi:branched-chain amino acid transport system substrate-binding protein